MNVVDLTKALIACPSVTPVTAGVYDVLEAYLRPLGFAAERQTFSGDGGEPVENLYLRYGTGAPNFCFAGHTDVVPPGDESAWSVPPFAPQIRDGMLIGRGAEDMKGAIAAFCVAAKRFIAEMEGRRVAEQASRSEANEGERVAGAGRPPARSALKGSISLLITQDEEGWAINGTKKMLAHLQERGEALSHCLVGEPTNPEKLGEMVKVGRRGSMYFTLTVRGKQGHVAYPERADNPVTRLVAMLHALKSAPIDGGSEFFPPSNLEITTVDVGNPTGNVIPAVAVAQVNVRFNDTQTAHSIERWVRARLAPFGGCELALRITGESFLTKDMALAELVAGAVKDVTGMTPQFSTTGGTSDARFIKDHCPVVEFGTTGATAHMVDERVGVETLEKLAEVYGRVLERYFAQ